MGDCKVRSLEGLGVKNMEFLPVRGLATYLYSLEEKIWSRSSLGYYMAHTMTL